MSLNSNSAAPLSDAIQHLLGNPDDRIEDIDARSRALFPDNPPIVWECDASTFAFGYVGARAAEVLGYPVANWLKEGFWAERVIHNEDRDDAVSYCALATAIARDHVFEYRGVSADGRVLWLRDYVKVIRSPRGLAHRLRGAMFDVTAEKDAADTRPLQSPTRADLSA